MKRKTCPRESTVGHGVKRTVSLTVSQIPFDTDPAIPSNKSGHYRKCRDSIDRASHDAKTSSTRPGRCR